MHSTDKRKLMLIVLAVLLIARFRLVPLFSWQQEQIAEVESKKQRLIKTNSIIARLPQINLATQQIQKSNQIQEELYFKQPSINKFKLELQQRVE